MPRRFPRYEKLLSLYPKAYRKKYGPEILQTLADMLDDQPSSVGRARVWLRTCLDLPINLLHQNSLAVGNSFIKDMPSYIKRNSIVASTLLLPFILVVTTNAIDRTLFNHTLYQSWLWSQAAILTWIVILPALALSLAVYSYLIYLVGTDEKQKLRLKQKIFNFRHTWPVILTGLFALGVIFLLLFHDSAHCWRENPVHYVTQWHQTWQCTTKGFLGGS